MDRIVGMPGGVRDVADAIRESVHLEGAQYSVFSLFNVSNSPKLSVFSVYSIKSIFTLLQMVEWVGLQSHLCACAQCVWDWHLARFAIFNTKSTIIGKLFWGWDSVFLSLFAPTNAFFSFIAKGAGVFSYNFDWQWAYHCVFVWADFQDCLFQVDVPCFCQACRPLFLSDIFTSLLLSYLLHDLVKLINGWSASVM